jgi:hypothetical protein
VAVSQSRVLGVRFGPDFSHFKNFLDGLQQASLASAVERESKKNMGVAGCQWKRNDWEFMHPMQRARAKRELKNPLPKDGLGAKKACDCLIHSPLQAVKSSRPGIVSGLEKTLDREGSDA